MIASAQFRKEITAEKNERIEEENLKYRRQLSEHISARQRGSQKQHGEELKKVVKAEERRRVFRKDVFIRHEEVQSLLFRGKGRSGKDGCSRAATTPTTCASSGASRRRQS